MAKIYKANGEVLDIEPKNGTDFQLEELQAIVGGLIDCQMTNDGEDLIVFNDRKVLQEYFKRHPYEKEATKQEKIDWWASLESSKRDYLIQLCSKELNNCIETTDEDIEIMYEYKRRILMKKLIILVALFIVSSCNVNCYKEVTRKETKKEIKQKPSEWDIFIQALIQVESEGKSNAVGKTNDVGILQITPIYVKDVNRILGEERYTLSCRTDIKKELGDV